MTKGTRERVVASMMWRRVDTPGHDVCRLIRRRKGWVLDGMAMFLFARSPCALAYRIECNASFQTAHARVEGWLGRRKVALDVSADRQRRWRCNGRLVPAVEGCGDIDINVSPSTNLLSLRRLQPKVGEEISVRAAWISFPRFKLLPLDQIYRRTSASTYDYRAPGLNFSSQLITDRNGFVCEYPPLWTRAHLQQ